jgi:putative aldouronate transport system permease protein
LNNKIRKVQFSDIIIYSIVGIFSFLCIYPFIMVISGSLSTGPDIVKYGISFLPRHVTFDSYKALFMNKGAIINGYKITIIVTVSGTFVSLFVNSLMGFVLARKKLKYRKLLNIYTLLTILFNGGMVPWYMVCVRYLHLKNTIFALILPMLVGAWNIFLIRSYFNSVPEEMYESAKIDGARDFYIYSKIYIPLATPVLATVGLFTALSFWNDWWLGLMLTDKNNLQPLQLLLRNIISNIQFLQTMNPNPELQRIFGSLPGDGIRMAMVLVTTGPIILLYPFVQRYFVKGIMIGAVKG